jgi:hypothetical protein
MPQTADVPKNGNSLTVTLLKLWTAFSLFGQYTYEFNNIALSLLALQKLGNARCKLYGNRFIIRCI